jgi:hypothetical protein
MAVDESDGSDDETDPVVMVCFRSFLGHPFVFDTVLYVSVRYFYGIKNHKREIPVGVKFNN